MPILTIYTPTFRRPQQLARCVASVRAQSSDDMQHLILEDRVGIGVAGMFRDIPNHHHAIQGDYVYFLSDDDVLVDPDLVRDLPAFVADHDRPEVIMARATIGPYTFPLPQCWESPPVLAGVTLANWIVRRDVWAAVPYGPRYEGDFDFIRACWEQGRRFAWWDRIICHAEGWGQGRPES